MKNKKICFKCGAIKSLEEFYKHKMMRDGHLNKCKECNINDIKENRSKKIEYYREYDRKRGNRQGHEYIKSYRESYPSKHKAHTFVNNAIRDGRLVRPKFCSECGDGRFCVCAHHDDYAYPMIVRWLCYSCHRKWHIENGEAPNGGNHASIETSGVFQIDEIRAPAEKAKNF